MAQLQQIYGHEETHAPILSSEEARGGVISGHVITVLVASLTLALVAGAILYVAYF